MGELLHQVHGHTFCNQNSGRGLPAGARVEAGGMPGHPNTWPRTAARPHVGTAGLLDGLREIA